jgi:hypothetical protein
MCRRWTFVGLLLILGACAIGSFAVSFAQERISKEDLAALPGAARARDAALAYVRHRVERLAPPEETTWLQEDATPDGLVGSSVTRFIAGDWTVTVSMAMIQSGEVVYHVTVSSQSLNLEWEGQVNADGDTVPSA